MACFSLYPYQQHSTPSIHVESVTPTILNPELQALLQEVAVLRRETDSFSCNCNLPDCPFNSTSREQLDEDSEKKSPDLGFGSMEALREKDNRTNKQEITKRRVHYNISPTLPLRLESPPSSHSRPLGLSAVSASKSLTNIPRGVQKRADGTILECDYPGSHGRGKRNGMISGFSTSHLNRLDVTFDKTHDADCLVDQDEPTNTEDYMFNRKAPERKLSRNWRKESSFFNHHKSSDTILPLSRHSSADTNLSRWAKKRLSTASS